MLPAKSFYLIRHGQSEANAARIAAGGRYDSPLTEKGREQAWALAPYLDQLAVKPAALYHSGMKRAKETAEILNTTLRLGMIENTDLREHEMGDWDGQPWDLIEPLLVGKQPPPNGETEPQFAQRIQATLTDILNTGGDNPFIVAHGGLFHAIGFLYEYAMDEVQNCALHHFEPNTEWDNFPWRVHRFDISGDKLIRIPAPFCLSRTMERIG